jgi:hypothetical protein
MDLSIIETQTNHEFVNADLVKISQLPCQAYIEDELKATFAFFIPIIINIALLFSFLVNINNIIVEKKSKMKEYLKLVGIKFHVIWLTWFIRIFLVYFLISIVLAIFGVIRIHKTNEYNNYVSKGLFRTTSFFVILISFTVYSIQSAAFIVLMAQFFKKRKKFIFLN